jgi:hypothetical protein
MTFWAFFFKNIRFCTILVSERGKLAASFPLWFSLGWKRSLGTMYNACSVYQKKTIGPMNKHGILRRGFVVH